MGGEPRIYENSIFPAYVPEKNKIITPWSDLNIYSNSNKRSRIEIHNEEGLYCNGFEFNTIQYGKDIKSRSDFCMNFLSQTIEVENKSITAFPMKSIIAIVDILKSIYQKHLAESTSINTKFTKLNLLI